MRTLGQPLTPQRVSNQYVVLIITTGCTSPGFETHLGAGEVEGVVELAGENRLGDKIKLNPMAIFNFCQINISSTRTEMTLCLTDECKPVEEFAVVFWWNRPSNPRVSMNLPVKPIDSWSRGIRRRLLVEPTFESPQPNRQLVKRNSPSSSGGTDLRISSPHFYSK
ncbi:unnamed protein product [Protopolystoma xenopodis]|uniref:Uncharacterized protein n=1 Tax=Protopolystoma xenopodis TaxID=117903 RepID=A0A448XD48_9PLAT|nr:unnamed protein product [Protopolystoma xenopodis]